MVSVAPAADQLLCDLDAKFLIAGTDSHPIRRGLNVNGTVLGVLLTAPIRSFTNIAHFHVQLHESSASSTNGQLND